MAAPKPVKAEHATQIAKREAIAEQFVQLVLMVPEADPGDITDLLGPILAAQTWEDLQNEDGLPSSKTLAAAGHKIRVDEIHRKISDKDSLTGSYLLCDGSDLDTGEVIRFTAGGSQAVATLSQLHVLKSLPAYVQFVGVPMADGNTAVNCKVLGVIPSNTIDG